MDNLFLPAITNMDTIQYLPLYIILTLSMAQILFLFGKELQKQAAEQKRIGEKVKVDLSYLVQQGHKRESFPDDNGVIDSFFKNSNNEKWVYVRMNYTTDYGTYQRSNTSRFSMPIEYISPLNEKKQEGGEEKNVSQKTKTIRRFPRIFKYAILTALTVLVWKVVLNADHIVSFIYSTYFLHK